MGHDVPRWVGVLRLSQTLVLQFLEVIITVVRLGEAFF